MFVLYTAKGGETMTQYNVPAEISPQGCGDCIFIDICFCDCDRPCDCDQDDEGGNPNTGAC